MKKMVCAVLFAVMAVFSTAVFAETGNPCAMPENLDETDGVYQIGTCGDLYKFAEIVNSAKDGYPTISGKLTADIVVNDEVLNADGTLSADSASFIQWVPMVVNDRAQVSLDGDGHTIRGLYVNDASVKRSGLFGAMDGYLDIIGLGIEDSYFRGESVGAFVGYNFYSNGLTIKNCHHQGVVVAYGEGDLYVGGLVGMSYGAIHIENSFNKGSIIVGDASQYYVGGLVGRNDRDAVGISNSYNTASISVKGKGRSYVGGLIGHRYDSSGRNNTMSIENCYNVGSITIVDVENSSVGGLVGHVASVWKIANSFFLGWGENFGGIGKPAEAFKNGIVAAMLHNGNSMWGQGKDYPDFSGDLPETIKVSSLKLVTHDDQTLEYPSSYVEGDAFDLPRNLVREGYVFAGWSLKKIPESAGDRVAAIGKDDSGEKTFYAQWISPIYGCYEIGTVETLFGFAAAASNSEGKICGKLTADIVINENVIDANGLLSDNFSDFVQWTPIYVGSETEVTFDGNGHTVRGMYVDATDDSDVGMFLGGGGVVSISNLGIVESYFGGRGSTGAIMGYCEGETISISNFYTVESVIGSGFEYISGGFVGIANCDLTIQNSFNASPVNVGHTDDEYAIPGGALVAASGAGKFIENSFFIGEGDNFGAIGKSVEKFKNGVVATLLHNYKGNGVDGSIWGQKQDAELPDFSGKVSQTVKTSNLFLVMYDGRIFEGITAYVEGDAVELPVNLTREGYIFAGWSTKKISESAADMVTSIGKSDSGDKIFYAQWVAPADGCFEIATAEALYGFAAAVNKGDVEICGKLTADIVVNEDVLNEKGDLSGDSLSFVQWTPIGTDDNPYMGDFDGAGHTISGLYLNDMFREYVGLFGKIGSEAKVRNVGVLDTYFNGSEHVGGVVGKDSGSVSDVYNAGTVCGMYSVGGVVGMIENAELSNAYNIGTVRGESRAGGVFGFVRASSVSRVYNMGAVSGNDGVGGIVGVSDDGSSIEFVYNMGPVDGKEVVGGVAGDIYDEASVKNSYNAGQVTGSNRVGGIAGTVRQNGEIIGVYNTGSIHGEDNVGGLFGWAYEATVKKGYFNSDLYAGVVGVIEDEDGAESVVESVDGKTTAELAALDVASAFENSEDMWQGGDSTSSKGWRIYTLPSLKDVGTAPTVSVVDPKATEIEISNANELFKFAEFVNAGKTTLNAKLTADIVVNEGVLNDDGTLNVADSSKFVKWTPIGTKDNPYIGTFDGQGHTVSGLYFNDDQMHYVGFFGYVGSGDETKGVVKNVGVVNSYIKGYVEVGGVVGYNQGIVSNSYNASAVNGKNQYVGGVVGYNNKGTVSNSYNTGAVSGNSHVVGGVVGYNLSGTISNSYNAGPVYCGGQYFGGVVGFNMKGKVEKAYYNEDVFKSDAIGGADETAIATNVGGKTSAELAAGTDVVLDADFWVVGAVSENVKRDTLYYPYLKVFGPHKYELSDVKKYAITVVVNDKAMGTVTGAGEYEYGTKVEIKAVANEGYKFTDWEDDVKTAARTITVTKAETYTANFEAISSSSSEVESSSSVAESSSSVDESSSSEAVSSSSEAKSSSSETKSSSSSAKSSSSSAKSSSSEAKSSSSQKESIIAQAQLPQFSVTAFGKMVSIAGVRPNTIVNVFDMQGNMVKTVVATSANFTFALPSAGVYIVKNGYTAKRVNVR